MIVYCSTKRGFLEDVDQDRIADIINQKVLEKLKRHTPKAEFRSWNNSMQYMYRVLNDPDIPQDSGVAIEYNIPQTSKRVDFMISGYGADKKPNVVIVELKQWESIRPVDGQDGLVETFVGGGNHKVVHPL